jgi:hypothetical protein
MSKYLEMVIFQKLMLGEQIDGNWLDKLLLNQTKDNHNHQPHNNQNIIQVTNGSLQENMIIYLMLMTRVVLEQKSFHLIMVIMLL